MGTEEEEEKYLEWNNRSLLFTNSGEQHVVQQKSNGHYDQDKFPGFPSRVKICPDIGAGHIVSSLGTHPDIHTSIRQLSSVRSIISSKFMFAETLMS